MWIGINIRTKDNNKRVHGANCSINSQKVSSIHFSMAKIFRIIDEIELKTYNIGK